MDSQKTNKHSEARTVTFAELAFGATRTDNLTGEDGAMVNMERILQVIRARWVCVVLMAIYGVYLGIFFGLQSAEKLSLSQMLIPVGAFFFVIAYNGWYHLTYRWWRNIHFTNHLQLIFDLIVVTVIIHLSGGVVSWFWAMYLLLTLAATFLLDWRGVGAIGILGALLYGGLLTAEFYSIIPPVKMPFENGALNHTFTYEMITWGWVSMMNAAVAMIGLYLMGIIRDHESALAESLDELTAAKKIIDRDLQRARQIQGSLLPLNDLPPEEGVKIGARMIPAREIGGDYYDYHVTKDGVYIAIGDVSGKGVEAGLIMAIARTLLRSLTLNMNDPVDILSVLGSRLKEDMSRNMFMSFLLIYWDHKQETLRCAGAGHEKIIIYRGATGECEVFATGGTALGVLPTPRPNLSVMDLNLGKEDVLVLYTDGITEAHNAENEFYTFDRLVECVEKVIKETPREARKIVNNIIKNVDIFRNGQELHDDMTVLVLHQQLSEASQEKLVVAKSLDTVSE